MAGGNLGVNSSFTVQTHPAPDVTVFGLAWPPGHHLELLYALHSLQIENAKTISTRTKIVMNTAKAKPGLDDLCVAAIGLYWGSKKDLMELQSRWALRL